MPMIPQDPAAGGLAVPVGAPVGMGVPPPDVPPAALGVQALAPLVPEQAQILEMVKAKLAEQAMLAAMQAVAGVPNAGAVAAQVEPGPPLDPMSGPVEDPNAMGGF